MCFDEPRARETTLPRAHPVMPPQGRPNSHGLTSWVKAAKQVGGLAAGGYGRHLGSATRASGLPAPWRPSSGFHPGGPAIGEASQRRLTQTRSRPHAPQASNLTPLAVARLMTRNIVLISGVMAMSIRITTASSTSAGKNNVHEDSSHSKSSKGSETHACPIKLPATYQKTANGDC